MAIVGFVGLGIMGRPMLRNLLKAGHTVVDFGRTPAKIDAAVADGAQRGSSNADVGARAEIVITMLPDGPEVEEVVLGPDGILSGSKPGSLIIDMSSISPLVSQKIASACAQKGVDFLDAPVSGGEPKAVDGTLAIMVGGKPEVFARAEPILKCMGSTVTLTGPVGAGNTTKLANQIMVACNIAAMGEALALATRAASILRSSSTPSRLASPAARSSTPKVPCSSRATSSPASGSISTRKIYEMRSRPPKPTVSAFRSQHRSNR
jgi:2-hydroxy-3-oxopropionate reductase